MSATSNNLPDDWEEAEQSYREFLACRHNWIADSKGMFERVCINCGGAEGFIMTKAEEAAIRKELAMVAEEEKDESAHSAGVGGTDETTDGDKG
jgi:hypothetical protein